MHERNGARIRNIAEVLWETPPEHYDAHSKMLVNPATARTQRFDHRISSYQPQGYVAPHRHKVQEQIYHVLDGEGLMELDGERTVVRRHDVIHIPPRGGARDLQFGPAGPGVHRGHLAAKRRVRAASLLCAGGDVARGEIPKRQSRTQRYPRAGIRAAHQRIHVVATGVEMAYRRAVGAEHAGRRVGH